jgi:hypothetical protein
MGFLGLEGKGRGECGTGFLFCLRDKADWQRRGHTPELQECCMQSEEFGHSSSALVRHPLFSNVLPAAISSLGTPLSRSGLLSVKLTGGTALLTRSPLLQLLMTSSACVIDAALSLPLDFLILSLYLVF